MAKGPLTIALDGPAGVGKSTLAKRLAASLGLAYLDTGAMYRTVALKAIEENLPLKDAKKLGEMARNLPIRFETTKSGKDIVNRVFLENREVTREIRTQAVSDAASIVSAHTQVRKALVERQQALSGEGKGVVMEGRDIGTVVLPQASVKFFLTADARTRARRRWLELQANGEVTTLERVLRDTVERDRRDCSREDSPLQKAADAFRVSTSGKTPDELLAQMADVVKKRTGR